MAAALYVAGACAGALFFGRMTDRFGRKKLFMVTLLVYLAATALTAVSFSTWWFFLFRFLTGFGIGGEYAAINSAIDELIPSKYRGRVDIVINGSFWLGAIGGSLLSILALNTDLFPANVGWRLTFALGVVLGLVILLVRRNVPESPRWLLIHGREQEAERLVGEAEEQVEAEKGRALPPAESEMTVHQRESIGFGTIARTVFSQYRRRAILGFSLFIGQAFLYNAITFGFGAILTTFYDVPTSDTGYYFAVIAAGNLLGPLLLGKLFDTVGRKIMISSTYLLSGVLLFVTAWLFGRGSLDDVTLTACWCVVLFFASAGASSAYLTVSEVFPMETRAMAIAFFYAIGTAAKRHRRPADLRRADGVRRRLRHRPRLPDRRGSDVRGGPGGRVPRGACGAALPGGHSRATVGEGVTLRRGRRDGRLVVRGVVVSGRAVPAPLRGAAALGMGE